MILNRRNMLLGTAAGLVASTLPAFASATQTIGGPAFGSYWRAVLPSNVNVVAAEQAITAIVNSVDSAMSPFKEHSEISQINAAAHTDWQSVSVHTSHVIAEGLRIALLTNGAFDPTVGPIVGRFGFGPITNGDAAGYQSFHIENNHLRKTIATASLDLCGIAKGHALDRMAASLKILGINAFLLEAGGEVIAHGQHPSGRPWQTAIETPATTQNGFQRILKLDGLALATSGDTQNGGQQSGFAFSHIIDPMAKRPVISDLASVSVVAKTAMHADALATAFMVMGVERGLSFAQQHNIPALFLTRDGSEISETMSGQFAQHIIA